MGEILIEGMEFYAYHGCYKEEQIIGNKFLVDLKLQVETIAAEKSDNILDAVNYQTAYQIVAQEMKITSHLLEHVASRILTSLYNQLPDIKAAEVRVSKINPPMGGKIGSVSVCIKR